MDGMYQDSVAMSKIAEDIRNDAELFGKQIEEMYNLISVNIGESDAAGRVWYGKRAADYVQTVNNKKADFDSAKQNIVKLSNNLQEHADAWNSFENGY